MHDVLRERAALKQPIELPVGESGCVHQLFEAQVDVQPDSIALASSEQRLTYQELEDRSNQLAHFLRSQGAGPGKLLGLYYDRSVEAIIAILGCLKSGSGYVPIDPAFPDDRISHILKEADIQLVVTQGSRSKKMRGLYDGQVLPIDLLDDEIRVFPNHRLTLDVTGGAPSDIAYVIYTSGTTGRPKGVVAEHGHVFRYALAFNDACVTTESDRIFQGFSLGFDGSVEEIWMAFSNGATLIAPTETTAKFGNDLANYLTDQEVTYFSTVPTLLSTITDDIPPLRQLVVSGEACPPELVDRWAKPGRQMLNVYGPTEATVNTTAALCVPGEPITIGRPLRGYDVRIYNEQYEQVGHGEKGEMFIAGETLARGYLNRQDLTDKSFVAHPKTGERLYKTGDLVRWNDNQELEFFGRIDGQVKIRGYRIELSEIESVLIECDGIQSSAAKVVERDGLKQIAAFAITEEGVDRELIVKTLKQKLPPYMVPTFLDFLDEFPMLASGKVNKKELPEPVSVLAAGDKEIVEPKTEIEKGIAKVWSKTLGLPKVCIQDDFFKDMGGYSLLAAQSATAIRKELGLEIAIRDIYKNPTVEQLAKVLELKTAKQTKKAPRTTPTAKEVFESIPQFERKAVKAMQAASIFLFYLLGTIPFSILVYVVNSVYFGDMSWQTGVGVVLVTGILTWPVTMAFAIGAKWALIGRFQPGRYKLGSYYYFRWWLASHFQAASGSGILAGTPLLPLYYRLMGAKTGKGCVVDTAIVGAWDLISIGDDTSVSADTQLQGYKIEDGYLVLGTVEIGSRCYVGGHSTLGLNTKMEDASVLGDQSYLEDGKTIPSGEAWVGSPAVKGAVDLPKPSEGKVAWKRPVLTSTIFLSLLSIHWTFHLVLALAVLGALVLAFTYGGLWFGVAYVLFSVPLGLVTYCLFLALLRKIIMPKAMVGDYPIDSMAYVRRWFLDGLIRTNRIILKPLYTTLYLPMWLRLMGAKIGKGAELSTIWYASPELLDIGPESFFADGCIVGGRRCFRGTMRVGRNVIGRRSFVGNGANVPAGKEIGDNCLLGVLSTPPTDQNPVEDGTEWLGNPSFALPHRKKVEGFAAEETFKPTRKMYLHRAWVDALRILFPGYLATGLFVVEVAALAVLYWQLGLWWMLAISPFISFALFLVAVGAVVALKWSVMGKFKPVIQPLWSPYIWWNEMVNGAYESVMTPLLNIYMGTPFLAPFLRALGMKIGKETHISSILFSEWDLIEIGDHVTLDVGSVLQTHLFEDRVFKSSYMKLDEGSSLGNMAIALYDTHLEKNVQLAPLSLLMKGEVLAADTKWHGIPTVECT